MTINADEYELLGYKVRLRPIASNNINPSQVVSLVLNEVAKIKSHSETHTDEAILLAALKFAADKIILEKEMKKDMSQLESSAVDALRLIEEAVPPPQA